MYYDLFNTPVGEMIVVADEQGLRYVDFQDGPKPLVINPQWRQQPEFLRQAKAQLLSYFNGELTEFDLPLAPIGTPFQQQVWHELAKVPHGVCSTYGSMANSLGKPTASRAIGMANGRNPLSIILPCHRVIGANHKLTGYRGGLTIKTFLLTLEGFDINDGLVSTPN